MNALLLRCGRRRPLRLALFVLTALLASLAGRTYGFDFSHQLPLTKNPAGTLTLDIQLGHTQAEFLLDTGASMVTLDQQLFRSLQAEGLLQPVRKVAARLASGAAHSAEVYQLSHFRLGDQCDLGPIEVLVIPGSGRNLLGLNALDRAAPFAIDTATPAIMLSHCPNLSRQSIAYH